MLLMGGCCEWEEEGAFEEVRARGMAMPCRGGDYEGCVARWSCILGVRVVVCRSCRSRSDMEGEVITSS